MVVPAIEAFQPQLGIVASGLDASMMDPLAMMMVTSEGYRRLTDIMVAVHQRCRDTAEEYGQPGNYVAGANIAGFVKVADAVLALGVV